MKAKQGPSAAAATRPIRPLGPQRGGADDKRTLPLLPAAAAPTDNTGGGGTSSVMIVPAAATAVAAAPFGNIGNNIIVPAGLEHPLYRNRDDEADNDISGGGIILSGSSRKVSEADG